MGRSRKHRNKDRVRKRRLRRIERKAPVAPRMTPEQAKFALLRAERVWFEEMFEPELPRLRELLQERDPAGLLPPLDGEVHFAPSSIRFRGALDDEIDEALAVWMEELAPRHLPVHHEVLLNDAVRLIGAATGMDRFFLVIDENGDPCLWLDEEQRLILDGEEGTILSPGPHVPWDEALIDHIVSWVRSTDFPLGPGSLHPELRDRVAPGLVPDGWIATE